MTLYMLPSSRSLLENHESVKDGSITVAAAKPLDVIDVVDLQKHEGKMMSSRMKDRTVWCRTQVV